MYRLRDWPKGEESEQNRCTRCRVCHSRNSYPGIVCDYCYERHLEEEAAEWDGELYEPPAREEQVYKQGTSQHSTSTNSLFKAAIGEATVALYKADYAEQADNLLGIAFIIRERIERFKKRYELPPRESSLIDRAFQKCYSDEQRYRGKDIHSRS